MNMQGLLAVLEEDKADLVGRRETHFAPVPLTGVQLEVLQNFSIVISLSAPPGALYTMAQLISSNNYHITERTKLVPSWYYQRHRHPCFKPVSGEDGGGGSGGVCGAGIFEQGGEGDGSDLLLSHRGGRCSD